ncbi:MAG: MlaE family ABC transporter permease [Limisphaerales bacterium]
MDNATATSDAPGVARRYFDFVGRHWLSLGWTLRNVGSFALITIAVCITKFRVSRRVVSPLVRQQIARAGIGLLPWVLFLGLVLGLVVIGQTVSLLTKAGSTHYIGTVMNTVIFRELGPITAGLLVLTRMGTATVVELGTKRARGEIEALEALGIDPVHYLVVPRVIGLALSSFALTIYLVITVMLSGLLFAILTDVPITPGDYFNQIASGLTYRDFMFLAIKTVMFGAIIAVVSCFHGLAQPIELEQVPRAASRAISQSAATCLIFNAFFIILYILLGAE